MLVINEKDNVCVALEGQRPGHKYARADIKAGERVIKYGFPIGLATCDIKAGEWVHTHNMKTGLSDITEYTYDPTNPTLPKSEDSFLGFLREDGRVGVRNEVWIIPTVGCVEDIARKAAALTGAYAFPHPYGCSQLGQDHENTQKALCGLIKHPNAGGVLVLGLGCENNRISELKKVLGQTGERIKFLECQSVSDDLGEAVKLINELFELCKNDMRTPQPMSKLTVGLKCGGSDGFSGITANPLVGRFSDMLISRGGSTILTEVPEMFGAEGLLMDRAVSREVFDKTVDMINSFKNYYLSSGLPIYENPSPGNKDGGITTLEEKSLGCTQKSGSGAVCDVLKYGQRQQTPGLNLLYAPGNDLVASTALAVSGAQIVLFTTGRGTPFGCPVPTVKISTNQALFDKKRDWIDFNAAPVLEGKSLTDELYDYVKKVAQGQETKNEQNGYRAIAIFKQGVTL